MTRNVKQYNSVDIWPAHHAISMALCGVNDLLDKVPGSRAGVSCLNLSEGRYVTIRSCSSRMAWKNVHVNGLSVTKGKSIQCQYLQCVSVHPAGRWYLSSPGIAFGKAKTAKEEGWAPPFIDWPLIRWMGTFRLYGLLGPRYLLPILTLSRSSMNGILQLNVSYVVIVWMTLFR